MREAGALEGRDYAAALCVVLVWGTNFVAMKLGLREVTPFQLGAGRYLFAALPLLLFVRPPAVAPRWVILYGLFQGVGQFGLLFLALRAGMSASLAPVMLQMQVFFTALFAALILKERIGRRLQAAMGIAALGLACLGVDALGRAATPGSTVTLPGFVLSVVSAAMWAASNIVVRIAKGNSPRFAVLPFMVWSSAVPILPFVALSLAFDPPGTGWQPQALSLTAWSSMAYLGWFATILGYAMWTGLLTRHPANRVAPFSLAVPPVGIAAGMLFLDETVTPWQWGGIALVVASLALVMLRPRTRSPAVV